MALLGETWHIPAPNLKVSGLSPALDRETLTSARTTMPSSASTCPGTEHSAYRMYSAILMATRSAEFLTASRSRCA